MIRNQATVSMLEDVRHTNKKAAFVVSYFAEVGF